MQSNLIQVLKTILSQSTASTIDKDTVNKQITQLFPNFDHSKPNDPNQLEIKSNFELNFRIFFNDIIKLKTTTIPIIDTIIQLCLICTELNYLDSIVVFQVFEDLFDSKSISECIDLFSLLESRADLFSQDSSLSDKGRKKNLLLKICIELLKRLSRSTNPDSCGRILMFLAYVFPLSDPSGLNIKGDHNIHNIQDELDLTNLMQFDESTTTEPQEEEKTTVDHNFYRQFWGLQIIFQNPQSILNFTTTPSSSSAGASNQQQCTLNKSKWDSYIESLELVLNTFSTHINLDELTQLPKNHYFTKYLTSSNLMKLQLKDSIFRRNIVTQMLITFQYFELTNSKFPNLFNDNQCYKIVSQTQPQGEYFSECLMSILKREKNWILWKRDYNCKSFERPSSQPIIVKKRKLTKTNPTKISMGNAELSRLWNLSGTSNNQDYLKTQINVQLETLIEPLKIELAEREEAAKKEAEKQQRLKDRELKRAQEREQRKLDIEERKKAGEIIEDEDEEFLEIDSDDLEDLDDPKPLLKDNQVYVWKTLRLTSRKKLELFKCQNFDEIIQSFRKTPKSSKSSSSSGGTASSTTKQDNSTTSSTTNNSLTSSKEDIMNTSIGSIDQDQLMNDSTNNSDTNINSSQSNVDDGPKDVDII
eukprot:gene594-740_t